MLFEYLIFLFCVLTQIYCCKGVIKPTIEHAKRTDSVQRRYRRAAMPQFIVRSQADDFTNANELKIFDQTFEGSPTDRIISTQQHYGLPNNRNYQQQYQANSLQKPRGNQQAHNSRELTMNENYNNNNLYDNNNSFNGNNMKHERNKMLQQLSDQDGIMLKHNRNNGNFKHHNSYQKIDFDNGNTRNSAILDTNVEMNDKATNTVPMYRPAVRVDAMHTPTTTSIAPAYVTQPQNHLLNPQNMQPNNYLLTEIITNPLPTTIKAPSPSEYNRSQFKRDFPSNPFLNKHMSQNEFLQNPFFANSQTNGSSQFHLNNQSTQNTMTPKPTLQNPYMSNPFLQNTKIPNLSGQSQPTSSQNSANLMHVQKPVIISSTPPSTVTKMSAELSRLIQNKAVIFPDSIYLTQSTPSSQHMLDIRR